MHISDDATGEDRIVDGFGEQRRLQKSIGEGSKTTKHEQMVEEQRTSDNLRHSI